MNIIYILIVLIIAAALVAALFLRKKEKPVGPSEKKMEFENAVFLPEIIKLLEEGHTATILLKGYSMRPFLESERDKAVLTKAGTPEVGKPVLAEIMPGRFVLHRIISIKGDEVTLLGDGNLHTEKCRLSDVKADVVGFYRKGRQTLDKTTDLKWRAYSRVWMALMPARRYLLAFYRRIWLRFFD